MPLVRRLLIALRTLLDDEPEPPKNRKRRPTGGSRDNRNRQTTALILTFRDLFRSGGLDILIDELEVNRRQYRTSSYNASCRNDTTSCKVSETVLCLPNRVSDSRVILKDRNAAVANTTKPVCQEETLPLLQEDTVSVLCTDLVPSAVPLYPGGLFSSLAVVRRKQKKSRDLTVPLNPEDENKTVETLRKALKWSPRKQNSTTFAVSLPADEQHTAIAVVENAVNRVKEEQLRKKKRKFRWLKI